MKYYKVKLIDIGLFDGKKITAPYLLKADDIEKVLRETKKLCEDAFGKNILYYDVAGLGFDIKLIPVSSNGKTLIYRPCLIDNDASGKEDLGAVNIEEVLDVDLERYNLLKYVSVALEDFRTRKSCCTTEQLRKIIMTFDILEKLKGHHETL